MIGEYDPVLRGERCTAAFTATEPNGTVHGNTVEFGHSGAAVIKFGLQLEGLTEPGFVAGQPYPGDLAATAHGVALLFHAAEDVLDAGDEAERGEVVFDIDLLLVACPQQRQFGISGAAMTMSANGGPQVEAADATDDRGTLECVPGAPDGASTAAKLPRRGGR